MHDLQSPPTYVLSQFFGKLVIHISLYNLKLLYFERVHLNEFKKYGGTHLMHKLDDEHFKQLAEQGLHAPLLLKKFISQGGFKGSYL